MHIVFPVQLIHAPGVKEDDANKDVNRPLLGKPETQFEATNVNAIQLIHQQNSESVGTHEPDNHAGRNQPEIGAPIS